MRSGGSSQFRQSSDRNVVDRQYVVGCLASTPRSTVANSNSNGDGVISAVDLTFMLSGRWPLY